MEFQNNQRVDVYFDKSRYTERNCSSIVLRAKVAELHSTKDKLKQAKRGIVPSWLDSRLLVDELRKLQADLEIAKNRSAMSVTVISELESQLEATKMSINSKREEEIKVGRMINEINDDLEKAQDEMDEIKMEADIERRKRADLKQVLRIREQTLYALQLTHRALRLELKSSYASAAEALQHITRSEKDATAVQLTLQEFNAITKAADEETYLHEWRVSASTGQRFSALESRDLAFKRFEDLYYRSCISKENKIEDEITRFKGFVEQEDSSMVNARAELLDEADERSTQHLIDVSESSSSRPKFDMVRKISIFSLVRNFVLQVIKVNPERRRIIDLVLIGKQMLQKPLSKVNLEKDINIFQGVP